MSNAGRPAGSFTKIHPTRVNGKQTLIYVKYQAMLSRCLNPNAHNFKWYGGSGVTICERWRGKDGFDNFYLDMGLPPVGLTLHRKKNELGYAPENCVWATWKEQAAHRRPVGPAPDPTSLRQRALAAGLPYHCVYLRVKRFGWTEERALSTPVQPRGRAVGWRKS
jgi:hypothetical protein